MALEIAIHGFNVKDPGKSTGKLKHYINNLYMFNYGWIGLLGVLFKNKSIAKRLKRLIDSSSHKSNVVYAHSNGSAIAVKAARMGAKIDTLVCINPALNVKTKFPETIGRILVISTRHDKATEYARFFDSIPFIEIFIADEWGAMGSRGYTGNDDRVTNWRLHDDLDGHSDFLTHDDLEEYMPHLKQWVSCELT